MKAEEFGSVKRIVSSHDLRYNGLTGQYAIFGTGILGVCASVEAGGLRLQVTHPDASPQSQVSCGNIRIEGTDFSGAKAVLKLYENVLRISCGCVRIELYPLADKESFLISVRNDGETSLSIRLSAFEKKIEKGEGTDLIGETFVSHLDDRDAWNRFQFSESKNWRALSRRGIEHGIEFGYRLAIYAQCCEREDAFRIPAHTQKSITAVVSVAHGRTVSEEEILHRDAARDMKEGGAFWKERWERSWIVLRSGREKEVEHFYYISKYLLLSGMYAALPYHFMNGVFRNDEDVVRGWAVAYWWYNQRCLYGGMNAIGEWDVFDSMKRMYLAAVAENEEICTQKYGTHGAVSLPETMTLFGGREYNDGCAVEKIYATTLEIALRIYEQYEYTGEERILLEEFYPLAEKSVRFYMQALLEKEDGKIYVRQTNARESYHAVRHAVSDVCALHCICRALIDVLENHGIKQDDFLAQVKDIEKNLAQLYEGGYPRRYLAGEESLFRRRTNWDDPALEAISPFGMLTDGNYRLLMNNFLRRIGRNELIGFISWDNSPIWAARLGLGDFVYDWIGRQSKDRLAGNCIGFDGNCGYELNGNAIMAINECMLQSYDGVISVFPSVPLHKNFMAAFRLYAKGGFCVESTYDFEFFCPKQVTVESLQGKCCRIRNPWAEYLEVSLFEGKDEKRRKVCELKGEVLEFETRIGQAYVLMCSYR